MADVANLAIAGALGALFLGVGAAPLQRSRDASVSFRLAVAGVVGLSTALLLGAAMVLAPLWHPELAAIFVLALRRVHASAAPLRSICAAQTVREHTALRALKGSPSLWCTLAGTALWLGSAILSHRIVPGIEGSYPINRSYAGLLVPASFPSPGSHEAFSQRGQSLRSRAS